MEYKPTPEEQQEYLAYDSSDIFFENLENGLRQLEELEIKRKKKKVMLIAGAMVVFDKGTIEFLNQRASRDTEYQYVLLSEVTAEFRRKTRDLIHFDSICTPHLLAKGILVPYMDVPIKKEILDYVECRDYLKRASECLEGQYRNSIGRHYAQVLMYYADLYVTRLLDKVQPDCVILWNEFYAFHSVMRFLCEEKGIKLQYMEFGCIPGTFVIESYGQQGESFLARYPYLFRALPVSVQAYRTSKETVEYIYQTGLNRNIQPVTDDISRSLLQRRDDMPVITFMGQNDYEAGIFPYTKESAKYHSPVFRSSLEAMEFLRLLSVKNGWRLLFKPHPLMQEDGVREIKDGVECLTIADINDVIDHSDLVITILSQSAYVALFRARPVVMLGYTQLKNSGCVYEAFSKERIESVIKKALKEGYTKKQNRCFLKHVARLLKYYLWDDQTHPEFPFGKN